MRTRLLLGMVASSVCSGHGMCVNQVEAGLFLLNRANRADPLDGTVRLEQGDTVYKIGAYGWEDGEAMQGCVCEAGWEGWVLIYTPPRHTHTHSFAPLFLNSAPPSATTARFGRVLWVTTP